MMNKPLTLGSLFDGSGGVSIGWAACRYHSRVGIGN